MVVLLVIGVLVLSIPRMFRRFVGSFLLMARGAENAVASARFGGRGGLKMYPFGVSMSMEAS